VAKVWLQRQRQASLGMEVLDKDDAACE